ncbi:MAG: SDR family oxidoreductase [Planctomycetota bacterium]
MTRIAVTAASGKLGAEIVKATLLVAGQGNVIGLARTPSRAESLGVEVRPGDYSKPDELADSLQGIDIVLIVSGMDHPDKRIEQHRNVIAAAQQSGVQKLVYTSVQGAESGTAFSPVIQSNRQTEQDVRDSGLQWVIGRNGIYIEPDVEYIDTYKQHGEIANCAGNGKCGYTTRPELAFAYARMLSESKHHGQVYNLHGEAITQQRLTDYFNQTFGLELKYRAMSFEEYRQERIAELGEFIGGVIAGIYQGIGNRAVDNESQYAEAAGRPHQSWNDYFGAISNAR